MFSDRLIPGKEGDRLIVSVVLALLIQGILALLLGFIEWNADSGLAQTYGPVEVRLTDIPAPLFPEKPKEPELPAPSPSPAGAAAAAAAAPRVPAPAPKPAPKPSPPSSRAASASPPSTQRRRSQAPKDVETEPSRREHDALRKERPAQEPEVRDQYSDRAGVEYGEEIEKSAEADSQTAGETGTSTGEAADSGQEDASVIGESTFDKLSDSGSRSTDASGTSGGREDTANDGRRTAGAGKTISETGASVDKVEFEGGGTRALRSSPLPDLSDEQVKKLPPKIGIKIAITVDPSGKVMSAGIIAGSGDTGIDGELLRSVRSWRFESSESQKNVEGTLTISLRSAR